MEQYQSNTRNYVVKDDMSLGEGRVESIIYPQGCHEGRNPVMMKDKLPEDSYDGREQKVGDHHEYA